MDEICTSDGDWVGTLVCIDVGDSHGIWVGIHVGTLDSIKLGLLVGDMSAGNIVGTLDGLADENIERTLVWVTVA